MSRYFFSFFLFIFLANTALVAQKRGAVWYFGYGAGLDFRTDTVKAITDGVLSTDEGCATLCDNQGNLLFYTDGRSVLTKKHKIMPNGGDLLGDKTSTQSSIIVQKPNSATSYYIFTVGPWADTNGLCYTVVDMSQNNGLGVVTVEKNIRIVAPTAEKVTAIQHSNGVDFWIVTHLYGNNTFLSYLLTSAGVDTANPVISNVGINIDFDVNYVVGYLKSNLAGTQIACANRANNVGLFNFDKSTGILTPAFEFVFKSLSLFGPYGVEFSPNGKLLYVAVEGVSHPIYQFNLESADSLTMMNTAVPLGYSGYDLGALQLGSDGRIYIASENAPFLGVIEYPDSVGLSCNYIEQGINLNGRLSKKGLPNFSNVIIEVDTTTTPPPVEKPDTTAAIVFPNVFTPNADGVNDLFLAQVFGTFDDFNIEIYNRWGSLVFQSSRADFNWDGTYNGRACADGTYFWLASFKTDLGNNEVKKGFVTLMR
jgi:gliding motility-associated-like protein